MRYQFLISLALIAFKISGCSTLGNNDEGYSSAMLDSSWTRFSSIPKRPAKALTGSEFGKKIESLNGEAREQAILRELRRGNMPSFLRAMQAVDVTASIRGEKVKATYWVTPDYLAIGSDQDYLYIPMTPLTAQRVADHFGFLLPTRKIVNDVFNQSEFQLSPQPLKPSPAMASTKYYADHSSIITNDLPYNRHQLLAGHKKDIVLTNKLCLQKRRVAIYGWHRAKGRPIQPLSLVHGDTYADYSHGVRLVAGMMLIDEKPWPVAEVLEDPVYSPLLSDEGPIKQTRIATECSGCDN